MNNNAKALKSGVWYTIANFIVKAMAFITTPIFTRLLSKEQFGDYNNFFSWTSIAVIIITMRMEASLISAKFDYENRIEQYSLSLVGLSLTLTAFWTIVLNIFSGFFSNILGIRIMYMNLMLVYCFFYSILLIFQSAERFRYGYKKSVFVALTSAVSTTVLSILLVLNMQDRLTGRVLGTVIPPAVIGMVLLILFIKNGKKIDFGMWPYALKISLPYVPHLLSLTVLNSVDRIMITRICGASDTALYSVAYSCGHIVTLLMTSMNSAFSPWLGEKLHCEDYTEIRKVTKYYSLLFCILAIIIMLLAPEILLILGGQSYLEAKYVMTPVAMGCVCQFLYTLFVNVEQYKKKTGGMAIASVFAAIINYILNLFFIPRYGYIAAAYTTLAGFLFLLLAHMFLVRRLKLNMVYDNRFILLLVIIMMSMTVGVNFLYANSVLRYIMFGIVVIGIGIVLLKKRTLVLKLMQTIIRKSNGSV